MKMKIAVLLFCAIAEETSTLILKEALAETRGAIDHSLFWLVKMNQLLQSLWHTAKGAPFLGLAKFNQKKKKD